MHSTDAQPLPTRPDVGQYRKLAKELLAAVKAGEAARIEAWARRWFGHLYRLSHRDIAEPRVARSLDEEVRQFTAYWIGERTVKGIAPPRSTLVHAQYVIARVQGFASWAELVRHIESLAADTDVARFEHAVDAIVSGDIGTLRRLLREHPELVRQRSTRGHHAPLLHYVSANGVEGYRQKTPSNIVAIAALLLESGADVNATAHCYGEDDAVLMLTATSVHPQKAGVMIPLLETLAAAGADMHHRDGGWRMVAACLANGQPQAARWLADHGAEVTLPEAFGIGRLDVIRNHLAPDGTLMAGATDAQLEEGFRTASWYGEVDAIRYLLDARFDVGRRFKDGETALHHAAYDGNPTLVELLLSRGSPVEVREPTYNGNALDWALWAWGADNHRRDDPDDYYRVVTMLRRAGETLKDAWYESEGGRRVMDKVRGDPRMQEALASHESGP